MQPKAVAGSNTVFSDDIVAGNVFGSDIAANAVTGAKIYPNTITGSDVNEASLALPKIYTTRIKHDGGEYDGDATSSSRDQLAGDYEVKFPFTVTKCSGHATPEVFRSDPGFAAPLSFPTVRMNSIAGTDTVGVDFASADPEDFGDLIATDFVLTLICPANVINTR